MFIIVKSVCKVLIRAKPAPNKLIYCTNCGSTLGKDVAVDQFRELRDLTTSHSEIIRL